MQFGPYSVELSNQDKAFFPDAGLTKGDLVGYYHDIAGTMVPYMQHRPLTMHRYPDGLEGEDWYQKNAGNYFPDWIETITVAKEGGEVTHVVCNNAATLVYLANQACISLHVWLSTVGAQNTPDRLIIDLDPPGEDFEPVRQGAFYVRDLLEDLGLRTYVMTTGSSGCHVVSPIKPQHDFDTVRKFAADAAQRLVHQHPDELTTQTRKNKRGDRLYLDVGRNAHAQTGIVPYSVRARPGAPVAAPLRWDELDDPDLGPQTYTIENIHRRLGQMEDPWKTMRRHARSLDGPMSRLEDL